MSIDKSCGKDRQRDCLHGIAAGDGDDDTRRDWLGNSLGRDDKDAQAGLLWGQLHALNHGAIDLG